MAEQIMIERVADQYRKDGYRAQVRPATADLPDFLGGFRPDVPAEREGERVVVAIRTRRELAEDPRTIFANDAVYGRPGWRMDVLVSGEGTPPFEPPADAEEPTAADLDAMLRSARRLLAMGEVDAAYLIGWGAVEAAVRTVARTNGVAVPRTSSAVDVLKTAYGNGLLSPDEYARLRDAAAVRNAIAHGLRSVDATEPELARSAA